MRFVSMVALVAVVVLATAGGAAAEADIPKNVQKVVVQKSRTVSESCPGHVAGLIFYRGKFMEHMLRMGTLTKVDFTRPRNCMRAVYLAHRWQSRAYRARVVLTKWLVKQQEHVLHDFVVQDGNNAWLRAVREAQRAYPGTESWLQSCSASEGGWGRWVPNSQGSGVGGWMQMYPSTWSTMFAAALPYLESRGFIVPASAHSWYSPLGQALAAAHGKTHGRGGEWYGGGCG